jgi:predicted dehydrogenase
MREIGIGIVGGGYMGKAHAAAFSVVGTVFGTALRPRLRVVCARTAESAEGYRAAYGFERAVTDWRDLVADPRVEAVVIASPQTTHRAIAEAAFAARKAVFCEKPLGASLQDAAAMVAGAEGAGVPNMIGFNYVRTPATQFARQLIAGDRIGRPVYARIEHTEDFAGDEDAPATWRSTGRAAGTMGDLAPHPINLARALMGPIVAVSAVIETVLPKHAEPNDDQAQMMLRFASGATGHLMTSRVAQGRKMGYAYEVHGTKGTIRFDGEDQNALHLYLAEGPEAERGFRHVLMGPQHPDFLPFCEGPGHGTGYLAQIVIEARDFLRAIETGEAVWPTFREGLEVARVVEAAWASNESGRWVETGYEE